MPGWLHQGSFLRPALTGGNQSVLRLIRFFLLFAPFIPRPLDWRKEGLSQENAWLCSNYSLFLKGVSLHCVLTVLCISEVAPPVFLQVPFVRKSRVRWLLRFFCILLLINNNDKRARCSRYHALAVSTRFTPIPDRTCLHSHKQPFISSPALTCFS